MVPPRADLGSLFGRHHLEVARARHDRAAPREGVARDGRRGGRGVVDEPERQRHHIVTIGWYEDRRSTTASNGPKKGGRGARWTRETAAASCVEKSVSVEGHWRARARDERAW